MADLKISQLTGATTPLAGTEVLPIVQSGSTKKATIANIVGAGTSAGSFTGVTSTAPIGVISQTSAGSSGYVQLSGTANYQVFGGPFIGGTVVEAAAGGVYAKVAGAIATATTSNGLEISTGNLIQGTAAKGINFTANTGAAGMTSQLLNWYEEGTWTPNQGAGLTLVGVFSSAGTYTRIGRQVFIRGSVSGATSVAVASAGAITTNLPYSAAADATGTAINAADNASSILRVSSATLTAATAIAATTTITFSAVYSV